MWNTKIEYFEELAEKCQFVNINFHLTDRVCKGYIRVINVDGVFVTTEMGDDQEIRVENVKFIPYSAISSVECGL
jgi:hypothetical protein